MSEQDVPGDAQFGAELLFTDGLPQMDDEVGYRGAVAARAAGITYRQLDYWARTGLVEPSVRPATGSGTQRLYSFRDILVLKVVKRLLDTGVSLHNIRTAVSQQLDQRGLRPAAANMPGDLKVQVWMIVDNRQQQVSTQLGGAWGDPWSGGFWGGPSYVETRTLDYQVGTLQIDLFDGKDGKLVWRGSIEQVLRNPQPSPSEREAAIRRSVTEVLSQYPPR